MVKPGLPTAADLYVLPVDGKPAKRSMFVDKVRVHMLGSEEKTFHAIHLLKSSALQYLSEERTTFL